MSLHSKTFGTALTIGNKAVKSLLKGTEEVPSAKRKLREFIKNGNYNDALRDFRRVHPRNVHGTYGIGGERMIGEMGDRTIILTRGMYRKTGRKVTIEIIKSKYFESGIERITYIDKSLK